MRLNVAVFAIFLSVISLFALPANAQSDAASEEAGSVEINAATLSSLSLRAIGPAVMGGRIADIAVDPRAGGRTWYLAVGSGGVWKTTNAGVTWRPIFDSQPSYSIGCVTLDPSNPDVVWVGTGENVSGRHVGWGDGVYKSLDGGGSWKRVGLESSEHIGEILVDPRDGNIVYVAAEGPLWSSGGERGLYKTVDGGENWEQVLAIDDDTGVTDVEMDPRNPDVLYAASYQRRRHVWAHMAGGPGSGIHKSTDGGATWRKIKRGLPSGDVGKIGLALSPANPDVVYATIEADPKVRGFYRSEDRGESWKKRNSYISNGTGPHYYQEIVASPHDVDVVYQMDVFLHHTKDGGKNMKILGNGREKHSDNHALYIDPADPNHLIAGTDGGLYETFDHGVSWRHFSNLPISQFYKLAIDNSEPFYNILGGAQDLGTLYGPARTTNVEGVRNWDWSVPLGADGYACGFDPEMPDLMYMEWQVGRLNRVDRKTLEIVDIQPKPGVGDPPERWNWDSPLVVSEHQPGRLYFASQRVWQSDDRGNSWTAISGDLSRGVQRYERKMYDRVWSVDALYDNNAMSVYATVSALAESPRVPGLIYAGTDDGLVQVYDDGEWRQAAAAPDVPELSFVNDVMASLHDDDTVFAVYDNHKLGDFRPLLYESNDRGASWRSIAGDLPENTILWSVVQDHVEEDLLFAGTEFGLYVTVNGGKNWIKMSGVPTISLRDLAIQRRDDDIVAASFGRGFYVLDDYSPLRGIAAGALDNDGALFPVRDAWWYIPNAPMQAAGEPSQGSANFTGANPPFGAVVTYYLKETPKTLEDERRDTEKELRKEGADVPFAGYDRLREEGLELAPKVLLTIRDANGDAVRRLEGPARKGLHRLSWDLRWPPVNPISLASGGFRPPWASDPRGPLVAPGRYTVEMSLLAGGEIRALGEAQEIVVKAVPGATLPADFAEVAAFQKETADLLRRASGVSRSLVETGNRIRHLDKAIAMTPGAGPEMELRLNELKSRLNDMRRLLRGDATRGRLREPAVPTIMSRIGGIANDHWGTRATPTATQRESLEIGRKAFVALDADAQQLIDVDLPAFEAELEAAGAPWTPGRSLSTE